MEAPTQWDRTQTKNSKLEHVSIQQNNDQASNWKAPKTSIFSLTARVWYSDFSDRPRFCTLSNPVLEGRKRTTEDVNPGSDHPQCLAFTNDFLTSWFMGWVLDILKTFCFFHSMMVMFYVKTASDAKDGQIVAEMLKSKIENEEGFFEFRMLRVEPYSTWKSFYDWLFYELFNDLWNFVTFHYPFCVVL